MEGLDGRDFGCAKGRGWIWLHREWIFVARLDIPRSTEWCSWPHEKRMIATTRFFFFFLRFTVHEEHDVMF